MAEQNAMSTDLLPTVQAALLQIAKLHAADRLLVACSGGPDSLALLHLLWRLQEQLGLHLHVAHLDHGLRAAATDEAAFVRDFAAQLGLPATIERRVVRPDAQHPNLLAAARMLRYRFLAETALAINARAVAVAHQADDQAETVLMHLLRGAGPAGLRGMLPLVQWPAWAPRDLQPEHAQGALLIRPLLDVPRTAIEAYCAAAGLQPRQDPTNRDLRFARPRLRQQLLPALQAENPSAVTSLARSAAICATDYDFIQQQLDQIWPQLVHVADGRIDVVGRVWGELHPALQRYALRRAVSLLAPGSEAGFEQIEALRAAASSGSSRHFPGALQLLVQPDGWSLQRLDRLEALPDAPQLIVDCELLVPGRTGLARGWAIESWIGPVEQAPAAAAIRADFATVLKPAPAGWAVFDAEQLAAPLHLRGRQAGDRIRPAGGAGSRSLQDLFVDLHIPRGLRDRWPVLEAAKRIVWVAGLRSEAELLVSGTTRRVLALRLLHPSTVGANWSAALENDLI